MKHINTQIESSIAIIKIDREAQLNALNSEVIKQLSCELEILERNKKA